MKQTIFIFLFFAFPVWAGFAQKNASQDRPPVNPGAPESFRSLNMEIVDSGIIRIFYALNATDISNRETYDDLQCLEIGSHLSKYYSYFVYNSDSLVTDWVKKHPNAQEDQIPWWLGSRGKYKGWSEYIYSEYYKNFSKNELTEYARMPYGLSNYNSRYSESIPVQNWEISDDTLNIAGYLCQKAVCRFRGRNYTAWFTTDVPVNNGPWKFGGLPGLILKVYDEEKQFVFECIQMNNNKQKYPIQMHHEFGQYKQTDRRKLWKFKQESQENYFQKFAVATGVTLGYSSGNAQKINPYNPMELE